MKCKIAHIADIHIKNKYVEYSEVLNILHEESPDIIVLVGDVIDSISNISPSIILEVTTFLISLTNIAPIIMIPGNHDINCKVNDIDFFTTITTDHEILKPPKFNYWRHSGQYEFNNILWTIIAPDEDIPEYGFDIRTQILLFHENLDRLDINSFDVFNAVMAGHLHNRQKIGNNGAYCGSLFQQNINESHNGHGFIIWNLTDTDTQLKFIDIKNDYGFLKVEIEDDVDITVLPIPEKVVLYDIYYINTSQPVLNDIINKYSDIYGMKPRNIKDKSIYSIESISEDSIIDINNINVHNELIKNYLKNNEHIDNIIELHKRYYLSYYNYQDFNSSKVRLLNLTFENMYNFTGSNYIDFTKLERKISGIIGCNNIGKTAIIDIILYALYDAHPRISSKKYIINKDCTSYNLILEFEINGKKGIINKGSSYTFYYDDKNLTQKTIPLTINEIKKVVGTYNDAILSSIQLQYNYNNFINMSPLLRKQNIANILSLKVFENIEEEIVKEISELTGKMKIINNLKNYENLEANSDKIRDIQYQIKYANILGIELNENNEQADTKLYEQMVETNKSISLLEKEKEITLSVIREYMTFIDNNNDIINEYNKYKEEITKVNNNIISLDYKINNFEPSYIKDAVINKYDNFGASYLYKLCKTKKDSNDLSLPASIIASLLLERNHNYKLLEKYQSNVIICQKVLEQYDNIEKNNIRINELKNIYNSLSKRVNSIDKLYHNLYEEYKKYIQKDIELYRLKESEVLSKELEILKIYRQVIKPTNGIISIFINTVLPKFEEKINDLLIDTDIKIKIEPDLEILYDVNGHWLDISLSSGYQKFILNLVFRLVLWQFADVVIPDVLIIDEGFGMCDSENISIITNILQKITKREDMPKLILIISHVDYLINHIEAPLYIENGKIILKNSVQFTNDIALNENIYYCNLCNVHVKLSSKSKHLSSQKHKIIFEKNN